MHKENPAKEAEPIEIGYLRTPMGLESLSVRTLHTFETDEKSETTLADLPPFAALKRTAISSPKEYPSTKPLLAAWDALSAVRVPNAEASAALWTVLTQTVPAAHAPAPRPFPFAALAAPTPPKPTAAHPRAFQGTTYQPPKDKTPEPIDLRPLLCDRAAVHDLLTHFSASDPFWAPRDDAALHDDWRPELSPVFIGAFGPTVRNSPWSEIAAAHALFQRLALERNEPLLACVAALFARSQYAPNWCEVIARLPPDQQAGFAGLLLDTDACDVDPATGGEDFNEIVLETIDGPSPAYRVYCLLRGLAHGVRARYLREGFRLNDRLRMSQKFHHIIHEGEFPAKALHAVIEKAEQRDDFDDRWKLMNFWAACGDLNGLGALIERRDWSRWGLETAIALLHLYSSSAHHDTAAEISLKWKRICTEADHVEEALERIPPEFQWKFVDNVRAFLWDTPPNDFGAHSISNACALLTCLCRPPFHPRRNLAHVWLDYVAYFDAEQRAKLIAAPDASFLQMEKSCRTKNTSSLIGAGGMAFAKAMPGFTLSCFLSAPARFFRVAKALGCLSDEEGLAMAQSFAQEPYLSTDLENAIDADLYTWIAVREEPRLAKAIPRELRAHYNGMAVLSAPRLTHYHTQMRRRWLQACLEMLENKLYDRLARGFEVENMDDDVLHALQMRMIADENRKPLKNLLAAHWAGRTNYLIEHPLTQEWLKKHPTLKIDLWRSGIPYSRTIEPYGQVAIAVEQDLMEALKLGTYVGSCLGLGGICAYSAAATVLDINKQVLYARDAKGTVVGRQVVAYAESDDLVCFSVYPISAPDSLRRLFAEYDRKFAAALGAPLFQTSEERKDYEIQHVISHGWWDDMHDHWKYGKPAAEPTPSP